MGWYICYYNGSKMSGPYISKTEAKDHFLRVTGCTLNSEMADRYTILYENDKEESSSDYSEVHSDYGRNAFSDNSNVIGGIIFIIIAVVAYNIYNSSSLSGTIQLIKDYAIPTLIGLVVLSVVIHLFKPLLRIALKLIKWGFYIVVLAGIFYWIDSSSESSKNAEKEVVSKEIASENEIQKGITSDGNTSIQNTHNENHIE